MKFYVAAADQQWARDARQVLQGMGHKVVARWIDDPLFGTEAGRTDEHKLEFAAKGEEDARVCDELLLHNDVAKLGLGGRHTEMGIAIALHRPVHLIGEKTNIFHWNEHVLHWPDLRAFYADLARRDKESMLLQAKMLAKAHTENDPGVQAVYWFPAIKEVRILDVSPNIPKTLDLVEPTRFPAEPQTELYWPSSIGMVRPEEFGNVALPEGWDWKQAFLIAGKAAAFRAGDPVCMCADGVVRSCRTGMPAASESGAPVISMGCQVQPKDERFFREEDLKKCFKRPLIIGFAGAPGCGKTTLARAIGGACKEHGFQCEIVPEYAREYIQRYGSIEEVWEQLLIFMEQDLRETEVLETTLRDVVIIETPAIVGYAYARLLADPDDPRDQNVLHIIEEMVRAGHQPDVIFYIQKDETEPAFPDGVRNADLDRIEEIDRTIAAVLTLHAHSRTLMVPVGEDAATAVIGWINEYRRTHGN